MRDRRRSRKRTKAFDGVPSTGASSSAFFFNLRNMTARSGRKTRNPRGGPARDSAGRRVALALVALVAATAATLVVNHSMPPQRYRRPAPGAVAAARRL